MPALIIDIAGAVVVLLLQTTVVRFLAIGGVVPDLVLLWIVGIAIRRGQLGATVAGFGLGLAFDLLSGPDGMLGLSALANTAAGFIAGYFYNENKILQTLSGVRFLFITALASAVHDLLYFLIILQGLGLQWGEMLLLYALPTTAYTVAIALLPMFAYARKVLA
jgi:rod shape-determining protein MreD